MKKTVRLPNAIWKYILDIRTFTLKVRREREWSVRKRYIHNLLDLTIIPLELSHQYIDVDDDEVVIASLLTNFGRITHTYSTDLLVPALYREMDFPLDREGNHDRRGKRLITFFRYPNYTRAIPEIRWVLYMRYFGGF